MDRDLVLSKIKKLLALTSSPSEGEAYNAMMMARKLMSKYHIQDSDIALMITEVVEVSTEITYTERWSKYRIHLCSVVADNNRCRIIVVPVGRSKRLIQVCGIRDDAEYVKVVIQYAVNYVEHKINDDLYWTYYNMGLRRDELNKMMTSYAIGFVSGLSLHYQSQDRSDSETAMMVITPTAVLDYLQKNTEINQTQAETLRVNMDLFDQGEKDGSSFFDHKQVGDIRDKYLL